MSRYRLGFDIGGTFTDFVLLDERTGGVRVHKTLTTPDDPSRGALAGLADLLDRAGVAAADIALAVHGTTLVSNALIERKGARVGLLTTKGFRDTLEIRTEQRYDIYDLALRFPEPLVPRNLRREVDERVDRDGRVLQRVSEDEVRRIARELRAAGVQAVAIVFLHSFRNGDNERAAARSLRDEWPEVPVSVSSEVAPEIREYERTSTTVANAFVQPLIRRYLERLEGGLRERGVRAPLYLMLSSGGLSAPSTVAEFPVRLVESGPAAGAIAAAFHGRLVGERDFVAFDMGGTTAKLSLVSGGRPAMAPRCEAARLERFKPGSGLPLQVPIVDLIEIGAGGGSIARTNALGLLKVGPESASADPGPACYARGGTRPTVTDADLLLGYLDPGYFLGGSMRLDAAAAERALARLGADLGVGAVEAAWGVQRVVNEAMAAAARLHLIERGRDPRGHPLLAFGGAGPVHARAVGRLLGSPRVICPLGAGVASALGLLVAPISFEYARSFPVFLGTARWGELEAAFAALEADGRARLAEAGARDGHSFERSIDGRYAGQLWELTFELEPGRLDAQEPAQLRERFESAYERRYGHRHVELDVELLTLRSVASAPAPVVAPPRASDADAADAAAAIKGVRRMYFEGRWYDGRVYERYRLAASAELIGPAAIEERESTVVLGPGERARVDEHANVVIELA